MEIKNNWIIAIGAVLAVLALVGAFVAHGAATARDEALAREAEATEALLAAQTAIEANSDKLDALTIEIDATQKQLAETQKELATKQNEIEKLKTELETPVIVTPPTATADGENVDDINLGDAITFSVDDQDLAQLFDGEITFDDEEYDAHEEFNTDANKLVLATSLLGDEEFSANPYLTLERGALVYSFVFDETIAVADITDDEPLKLTFLGQPMELVDLTSSQATIRTGKEVFLSEGASVVVEGKTLTLNIVGENGNVQLCVNGECAVIEQYETELVGGLDVRVEDVLSSDRGAAATLVVGADTIYEQKNNDEWFDNEEFKFEIVLGNNNTELQELRVVYDEKRLELDDDFTPVGFGQELCFPNEFVCVKFTELDYADYVKVELSFDDVDVELANGTDVNVNAVLLEADTDNTFVIGTEEVDAFYVGSNGLAYFEDAEGDWFEVALNTVTIENDEAVYTVELNGGNLEIEEPATGAIITIVTDFVNEQLGADEKDSEASELVYGTTQIGNREFDVLTEYGTVIENPESNGDRDEVVLRLPSDRVEATILVH